MAIEKCRNRVSEAEKADSIPGVVDRIPDRLGRWRVKDFRVCPVRPDRRFEGGLQMSGVKDVAGCYAVRVDVLRRIRRINADSARQWKLSECVGQHGEPPCRVPTTPQRGRGALAAAASLGKQCHGAPLSILGLPKPGSRPETPYRLGARFRRWCDYCTPSAYVQQPFAPAASLHSPSLSGMPPAALLIRC